MRKTIIATLAAAVLLGCGKDSTGPGDGNPNPDPKTYLIMVNGTDFSPDTLPASPDDTVYVGDYIKWTVTGAGEHQITFVDVPPNVPEQSTGVLTEGQSDSVSFITPGTYKYQDTKNASGNTGVLIITALP